MKKSKIRILMSLLLISLITSVKAQLFRGFENPQAGNIPSLQINVTYDKTTHLIFPSPIRYVDLGSNNLVAGKADDADNVLRIKANQRDFYGQTNFSVITEDGKFYGFDVNYLANPDVLSIDVATLIKHYQRRNGTDVLFEELNGNAPSLIGLIMETIYQRDKTTIKHIGSKSFGISFLLKGLYIHDGKFYFHTEIQNETQVPFHADFVSFSVVDKRNSKRTVIQEKFIKAKRIYKTLDPVLGKATEKNIFMLDQFTLSEEKVLLIEMFEKNGGRHQILQLENSDLISAKLINDMHLKIR